MTAERQQCMLLSMTLNERVTEWQMLLSSAPEVRAYLEGRGLTEETVERFALGYDPEADGITIPYRSALGKVITVKLRKLSGKPKYLTVAHDFPLPEPRRHLFNARALLTADRVVVTEGEFDCMIASQLDLAAVSIPGVSAFEDAWLHLFRGCDVLIAFDGDEPGRDAAAKLSGKFTQRHINCSVFPLPEGKDLSDLYVEQGESAVWKMFQ